MSGHERNLERPPELETADHAEDHLNLKPSVNSACIVKLKDTNKYTNKFICQINILQVHRTRNH